MILFQVFPGRKSKDELGKNRLTKHRTIPANREIASDEELVASWYFQELACCQSERIITIIHIKAILLSTVKLPSGK